MKTLLLLLSSSLLIALAGCGTGEQPVFNANFPALGTLVDVTLVGETQAKSEAAARELGQLFKDLDQQWSNPDSSPLAITNKGLKTGTPFTPPAEILPLLQLALPLAEKSEQLFNPAMGELIDAWGFRKPGISCNSLPDKDKVQSLLAKRPTLGNLVLDGDQLKSSNPAVKLDFSAIGRSYAIDLAIKRLRDLGIENALVNAGGDLRAIGSRDGRPWRAALRRPTGAGVYALVEISDDESIYTTGEYEQRFSCNGITYHHIIDPRTGYPVKGSHSVTLIHTDAVTAAAAATALFVAGPQDWARIAERMGITQAALLDDQGILHVTPEMEKRLRPIDRDIAIKIEQPPHAP